MVSLLTPIRLLTIATGLLASCSSPESSSEVVVSVKDQKMGIYSEGTLKKEYAISTSKFGLGDEPNSYRTPLGKHEVIAKIGHGLPPGAVLKSRHWNGEVLKPNAPGRDPIVSRILWLNGLENGNSNARQRFIYIHGTPEESRLGQPASYGCIRMGMKDVVDAFNEVSIGDKVVITKKPLPAGKAPPTPPETAPEEKVESPAALTPEPAVIAKTPAPAADPAPTAEPVKVAEASPREAFSAFFRRLFYGPVTEPATPTEPSSATTAVVASEPLPASAEAPVPSTEAVPGSEKRSFLSRLRISRKSAPPASEPPAETGSDVRVGPEKPAEVAKQRGIREARADSLSSTRPHQATTASSRA